MNYRLIPWDELMNLTRFIKVYWIKYSQGEPVWSTVQDHDVDIIHSGNITYNVFRQELNVGRHCWIKRSMYSDPNGWYMPFEIVGDSANGNICPCCCNYFETKKELCSTCIAAGARKCATCGKWTTHGMYCPKCSPIVCSLCEKTYPNEDFLDEYGSRFVLINYSDDENICKHCYKKYENYMYNPKLNFKGRSNIFFGIELEFELADCPNDATVVSKMDFSKNDRFIKSDGSLDNGIEFVTMPCSLSYHKNKFGWKRLCKVLKDEGCDTPDNCGLHIHFSRKFDLDHEKKIYWFVYKHISEAIKIAGRRDNSYAKVRNIDPSDEGFERRNYDRYAALNFTNRNTIEFRLPAGTLSHSKIMSNLEFLDAMINYTKDKSLVNIKTLPWETFTKWLSSSKARRNKYCNLIRLLNRKTIKLIHTERDEWYDRSESDFV